MVPINGRPLMELALERLREAGIGQVTIATRYLGERIVEHFGSGEGFGIDVRYVAEDSPLGTAGALALLDPPPTEPVLVMNADILTDIDFRALARVHRQEQADLTIAVRRHRVEVPYGVVEQEGARVRRIVEKPQLGFLINAGIYLLEPTVLSLVPCGERLDMPELIARLIAEGRPVAAFPVIERWIDVGTPEEYARAQEEVARA
jgi:NDP-sugar pyrophosphorylase family protein